MAAIDAPAPESPADRCLAALAPALWAALSPLGRRARLPENFLPQQSAEARGKPWNATIGQITDGHGGALPLAPMAAALAGLAAVDPALCNRALLYSPVEGFADLRQRWRGWQRRGCRRLPAPAPPSSLPLVTTGPVLALSLLADLFLTPGRTVALPEPRPAGYEEIFTLRSGAAARSHPVPAGRPDAGALAALLAAIPPGEPAMAVVRVPAAAGEAGLEAEAEALATVLIAAAAGRPLVVVLDDTWEPWEPWERDGGSLYWRLAGRHPNLIAIKVDGAAGELGFPGGGVAFVTFPYDPAGDSQAIAEAIEGKAKMLLRAVVGSPSSTGQALVLAGLAAEDGG